MKAREKESERMLFPSTPNPDFREVHAEISRNFRENLLYNPGFPASAISDDVSHDMKAELCQNFHEKCKLLSPYHGETVVR